MNIFAKFAESRRRRQAARQLRAFPDALLRDIGIEPHRIDDAVSGMLAQRSPTPEKKRQRTHNPLFFISPLVRDWPHPHQRAN